jgi:hypothetical protein
VSRADRYTSSAATGLVIGLSAGALIPVAVLGLWHQQALAFARRWGETLARWML